MSEVLDYAPEDLTPAERLVLVALAERADDDTRLVAAVDTTRDMLLHRTGLTRSGVKKILTRLGARDLEVRVQLGTDKHGRPVYARDGQSTTYRIPVLRGDLLGNPLRGPHRDPTDGSEEAPPGPLTPDPGPPPAEHDELQVAADQVRRILGDVDDADVIAQQVLARHHPGDLARYIASIPPADLARYRPSTRTPRTGSKGAAQRCDHGEVGGDRILGRGEQASRKCDRCEAERPAWQPAAAS